MTIQSDPNREHLINGYGWEEVKSHFLAKARANDVLFDLNAGTQRNGMTQACAVIVIRMRSFELASKFYTIQDACQKLVEGLPEIESIEGQWYRELNETYNELRYMVAPLQDLKRDVYYRTASALLAKVTKVHSTSHLTTYSGVIFDKDTNHEGIWDLRGL
jgi:hypothetical protein